MMKMEEDKRHVMATKLADNQQLSNNELTNLKGGVRDGEMLRREPEESNPRGYWHNFFYNTMAGR